MKISEFDVIISHFDGNEGDLDDISGLPMAALFLNAAGVEDKSTFFYNNNLGEPSVPSQVKRMREAAAYAEKLGVQTHDYEANSNKATQELVKLLNSGQKVLSFEGGPMEAIYRALEQTSPENRKNITLMSHSGPNERMNKATRPDVDDVRTWAEILRDFPEVSTIQIADQNFGNGTDSKGFANSLWSWLNKTSDPVLQEAREIMRNAENRMNDTSDAGMHFFAITGNEFGDPLDAKAFFEKNPPSFKFSPTPNPIPEPTPNPIPTPNPEPAPDPVIVPDPMPVPTPGTNGEGIFMAQNGKLIIEAESTTPVGDWKPVTIEGEQSLLWDAESSSYRGVPAGQTLTYNFETDEAGDYFIGLHSGRVRSVMNQSDRFRNGVERKDTGNDVFASVVNAETGDVVRRPTKLFTSLGDSDRTLEWGRSFDINHQFSPSKVSLKSDTQYRLEISGRSDGYALDRITLSNDGLLRDENSPQSPRKGGSNPSHTPAPTPEPTPAPTPEPIPAPVPTPTPKPISGPTPTSPSPLFSIALVNPDTDKVVEGFEDLSVNNTINLADVDLTQYNLVAKLNSEHPDADHG